MAVYLVISSWMSKSSRIRLGCIWPIRLAKASYEMEVPRER